MGHVLSSDTIYAVAYLTELGRKYLFDPIANNRFTSNGSGGYIDAFKIVYFSMSDPDYNYNITDGNPFETGDIANISGKNNDCIKGTVMQKEENLISVNGQIGFGGNVMEVGTIFHLETDSSDNYISIVINDFPIQTGN